MSLGRVLAVLALLAVVWFLIPGQYPYGMQIDQRIELEFDGRPVVLEHYRTCTRSSNFGSDGETQGFFDSRGPLYLCDPEWFTVRLPDGGALLVGATGYPTHHERRKGVFLPGPCAYLPTVFWVDDAVSPTRGEFTFAEAALADPRSRVKALTCEVTEFSSWPHLFAPFRALLHGAAATETGAERDWLERDWHSPDPYIATPWLAKGSSVGFRAFYMTETPESLWQSVPGLQEVVDTLDRPTPIRSVAPVELFRTREFDHLPASLELYVIPTMSPLDSEKSFIFAGWFSTNFLNENLEFIYPLELSKRGYLEKMPNTAVGVLLFSLEKETIPTSYSPWPQWFTSTSVEQETFPEVIPSIWNGVIFEPETRNILNFHSIRANISG